ncbi:sigma-54 dependent transcriptional regulator [Desulfobacterales bacterium HSG17]|nr:sigma-54 dependent transcriptional regulator [Desulfobacterales bacterium HSG17]
MCLSKLICINHIMNSILTCWIGFTDLKASDDDSKVGLGPIAQAVTSRKYEEVCLISDLNPKDTDSYITWIETKTDIPIKVYSERLSGPTVFSEIYESTVRVVNDIRKKHGDDIDLTFHISPGTPHMAAVWIILSKTRFPAEIIESSQKYGVRTASVPFDISADFIPDLLRKSDKTLERLAAGLPAEAPEFDDIIHRSKVMQKVILKARQIAPRSIPVLIEGESGTGKELFARAIHDASPRRNKAFVSINCGAIPSELVESELFGHEKGAFTGATSSRVGHFEAAHRGTIFLDEIGELPKEMQVKILRTVQEGEVKKIGSTKVQNIDIRIIAATNRNLINEVSNGSFREDLFYRLAVAVIKLPPLRDRLGDISLLIDTFLKLINKESRKEPNYKHKKISVSARNLLLRHPWPGNVRELQNTLTRAAVWALDEELNEEDIREALLPIPANSGDKESVLDLSIEDGINLPEIMKKVAVHYLQRGLTKENKNKTKTASLLGLSSYQTLTNWLKKYGLE